MSVKIFIKELNNNGAEGEIVRTVFISLITSLVLFALLYFLRLKYVDNFIPKYGFYLFFAILSYSLIIPSVRYVRAYKEFACMSGMMIGMTIGMIAGFLAGFFIASTNGMFVGSVSGIVLGIWFGAWNGKCCGIMGVMEGMMAGLMGGLMGAMTSIMMLNDNLKAAGVIVFLVSGVILFGLNYMLYKETREMQRKHKDDTFFTIFLSVLLTAITLFIMVWGPRSGLFQ